jgi:glycyl-tRNA synthetase
MATHSSEASASLDDIMSFCKAKGFLLDASGVYGAGGGGPAYGPLGAQLKRNLISLWWKQFVEVRSDVMALDTSILLSPDGKCACVFWVRCPKLRKRIVT